MAHEVERNRKVCSHSREQGQPTAKSSRVAVASVVVALLLVPLDVYIRILYTCRSTASKQASSKQ